MSENLGLLAFDQGDEQIFLGREIAQHRDYSEETARKIDEEIYRLIDKAYQRARKVLQENKDVLHKLAELLLEKETVMGAELDEIIKEMRPGIELSTPDDSYLDDEPDAADTRSPERSADVSSDEGEKSEETIEDSNGDKS